MTGDAMDAATKSRWIARQWFTASGCLVAEAEPGVAPPDVFRHVAAFSHPLFLDSALVDSPEPAAAPRRVEAPTAPPRLGRFSFVAADPIHSVHEPATVGPETTRALAASLAQVRQLLGDLACPTIPGLPPFQGGVAGLLSYRCSESSGTGAAGIAGDSMPRRARPHS